MKLKHVLTAAAAAIALVIAGPVAAANWKPSTPPLPVEKIVEDWPLRGAVMSPDGKHIAGIAGVPGQNPAVKVWSTDNLQAPPRVFGSKTMRFVAVNFIKNDRLLITVNQPVQSGARSNWFQKALLTDLDGKEFIEPLEMSGDDVQVARVGLFNRLPNDPQHALMSYGADSGAIDIYKVNVYTGRGERVFRGTDTEDPIGASVDRDGNIRAKTELVPEGGTWINKVFVREPGQSWREITSMRQDIAKREGATVIRMSREGDKLWINSNVGTDFNVIREVDTRSGAISEPIFQNTEYDAATMVTWAAADEEQTNGDNIAGFCYDGPSRECVYTNPILRGIQERLVKAFPGQNVQLSRVVDSGNLALILVTGPAFPDTWYVLRNQRQLTKIGSVLEGFDNRNLGSGQWVTYPARDGLKIPGVLYLPPGYDRDRDGRIPLVVMPHGGPWARDDMDFDISFWPQMFATRGFAVLMPQYRGSDGLGKVLWRAGDNEWGGKMQDDKDDGARWLVDQGIADPNRMMMYGYSYGGFAAAAAAARSSGASMGLWQCAISGAPAIDLARISNDWGDSRIQRIIQGVTVGGWDPQAHLDQVQIPWLVFHGDYDRQADTIHSRTAAARMRSLGRKDFRYVEIKRMAHTLIQMTPEHRKQFIPLMLDWMDTNCGNISATVDSRQMASK